MKKRIEEMTAGEMLKEAQKVTQDIMKASRSKREVRGPIYYGDCHKCGKREVLFTCTHCDRGLCTDCWGDTLSGCEKCIRLDA